MMRVSYQFGSVGITCLPLFAPQYANQSSVPLGASVDQTEQFQTHVPQHRWERPERAGEVSEICSGDETGVSMSRGNSVVG